MHPHMHPLRGHPRQEAGGAALRSGAAAEPLPYTPALRSARRRRRWQAPAALSLALTTLCVVVASFNEVRRCLRLSLHLMKCAVQFEKSLQQFVNMLDFGYK